jgi:serine/threonine-protein kinase
MAHFRQPHTLPDEGIGRPAAPGRWFVGGANTPERQALERAAYRDLAKHFDIVAVLQRGSTSVLYDARDIEADRRVALRVVSRAGLDAGVEERLVRALSDAASMDHPNIVAIQRSGSGSRVLWYAMEFVEGPSLATLLRDHGPLDLRRCLTVIEQTAAALQYAHRRGVVHGDVHPANIFVFGPGWVLVSDFALGRPLASLAGGESWAERHRPLYRAPEEEASELPPSPTADQYALALTTWECLTGAAPGAQHEDHALAARLTELRPDLPPHVGAALQRALRSRPSERFPSVQEFVAALGSPGAVPVSATVSPPRTSEPSPASQRLLFVSYPQRSRARRVIAGSAVAAAALVLGVLSFRGLSARDAAFSPAVPILGPGASTPAPAPPGERTPAPRADPPEDTRSNEPPAAAETESPQPGTPPPVQPNPEAGESDDTPAAPTNEVSQPPRQPEPRRTRAPARSSAGTSRNSPAPVTPAPETASAPTPIPGRLFISSRPWGQVFVDGQLVGNTPIASVSITPGAHVIRIVRPGFRSYERELYVTPGQDVRLVDLVLEAEPR